jgi:transcriptional regulator with XRE-family HTH domain
VKEMSNDRQEPISARIKKALKIKGMRQAELCKLANVPKSSLSQYLSGDFEPKQDRIYLIAKALNVSEAWLMGFDVPMERQTKKTSPEEPKLTEGEKILIDLFRRVPEDKQELVLQMIRVALGNQE